MSKEISEAAKKWDEKMSRLAGLYPIDIFKRVFLEFIEKHGFYKPAELAWEEIIEKLIQEKGKSYPERPDI